MRELKNMSEVQPFSKENFQYAKGVAILLVMISHIANSSGKTWFTPLGGIGVAIFLFCSGYGVMTSYYQKGLLHYWGNKIIGIWIPFAGVEVVSAFLHKYSVLDVVKELVFIKVLVSNGWYTQYLMICYILFYIGVKLLPNSKSRFGVWGMIALLSFVLCGNLRGEQALSFVCGLAIAEYNHQKNITLEKVQILCVWGGCITLALVFFMVRQLPGTRAQMGHLYTFLNIFFKGGFAIAIIAISSICKPMKKLVLWVGSISYPLYLVHGYFQFIVDQRLAFNFYISAVLMLICSFVVAMCLNFLIRKLHALKH